MTNDDRKSRRSAVARALAAPIAALIAAGAAAAAAQELEPRAYSPSPVGANFLAAVLTGSQGDVLTDPSLPVTNVNAHINGFGLGYGRTFALFGRQALVVAVQPYAWGNVSGDVGEDRRRVTRSGLADLKAKVSINLYGNPAQSPEEFARAAARTLQLGASLTIAAPTGQYDPTRLINLGTNRWAFKPEVGASVPVGRFFFDAYVGVIFFTANSSFYPGENRRTQDPLPTVQFHVSYTFRPGLWLAVDSTWYGGGASHVNGGPGTARSNNTRIGGTISLPLGRGQSFKLAYSTGAAVRAGQDFKTLTAAWQILWF